MDPISGIETEMPVATLSGEALDHYTSFSEILQNTDDGPLDQTRYPWCEGQDSLDPSLPSTVAGCAHYPG
jgi:hypothetical protein